MKSITVRRFLNIEVACKDEAEPIWTMVYSQLSGDKVGMTVQWHSNNHAAGTSVMPVFEFKALMSELLGEPL